MADGAQAKHVSKQWIQELINDINIAVSLGAIASAGGTVTTALADLATEKAKH